jgi:hypothetical protein
MVAGNELLSFQDGHVVIRAVKRERFLKFIIWADDIRAVIRHIAAPFD